MHNDTEPEYDPEQASDAPGVTRLPDAGREAMLDAAGLSASEHWPEADHSEAEPDTAEAHALRRDLAGAGLRASDYDEPEPPALPRWNSPRGGETAFAPWRRVGDYYEAAAPLTAGPTRYRVLEQPPERRHEWGPRYVPPSTYPSPAELAAGDWVEWDDEIRLGPHWYEFPGETIERFSPRIDYDELTPHARQDTTGRYVKWRDLPDARPEPDLVMWDDLPRDEQSRLRLLEYELPWLEYTVSVSALPDGPELTATQRDTEALMSGHPDDDRSPLEVVEDAGDAGVNVGRRRGARGWHVIGVSVVDRVESGWHVPWREATGFPPGRPPVPTNELETLKAGLLETVGLVDWVRRLTRPGRVRAADVDDKHELERRFAAVLHDGRRRGTVKAIEELYGLSRETIKRIAERGGLTVTRTIKGEE